MSKVKLGVKFSNEWFVVGEIVEIEYSNYLIAGNSLRIPTDIKKIKGRISSILSDRIIVDCSELYNSKTENIYIEEILNMSKI